MNKVLFKIAGKPIKVIHLACVIIMLLILLLGIKGCSKEQGTDNKDTYLKESNVCVLTKNNLQDLNQLLARSDLCSEGWYKDVDAYLFRLKEQNQLLKKKDNAIQQKQLSLQKKLVKCLVNFKEESSDQQIEDLEEITKQYQNFVKETCKEE